MATHPESAARAEVVEQREPTTRAAAKPGSALRAGVAVLCGSVVRTESAAPAEAVTHPELAVRAEVVEQR
ncbi:hypothetical protein, partial [Actinoplanes sp. NPDC048796]|uniref:hypothetical protein n=1 Tax=Actinoplanes sp. NPDC048796 TaxID=3155640 RepID=UPI0033D7BA05